MASKIKISQKTGPMFDTWAMEQAIEEAKKAERKGEVPVGAVITHEKIILARAGNAVIARQNPTTHAEILAIAAAAKKLGNYRLNGCTLYSTVEPCIMCVGAIIHARIERVVYGAVDKKWGGLEGLINIPRLSAVNHRFKIEKGILAEESRNLLQVFFKTKRIQAK
jgi:tRNA(adenine34) deaminase